MVVAFTDERFDVPLIGADEIDILLCDERGFAFFVVEPNEVIFSEAFVLCQGKVSWGTEERNARKRVLV